MPKTDFFKSLLSKATNELRSPKLAIILFVVFLGILIADRVVTLLYFGFVYTDLDQMVMWNGAVDYSKGIFHEPFFYGQAYNYMLEAFLAVPLLWMNVPVYYALPIVTSVLSLLPFIVLGVILFRKKKYFWAYCSLVIPVLLPIEYNFLTTISRGFVQAHFFVPFLFLPLFAPEKKSNIIILYVASALSFIANQSSVIIIVPIFLYIYSYHYRSVSFYVKSLLVLPFLFLDFKAKQFYRFHPERVVHEMQGLKIDGETFLNSITHTNHFEYLFPFFKEWGILYLVLLLVLIVVAIFQKKLKVILFIGLGLLLLLITFSIPKVQQLFPNGGGIFFSPSRLYLFLPLFATISIVLIFSRIKVKTFISILVLGFTLFYMILKNYTIVQKSAEAYSNTACGVDKIKDLQSRAEKLNELAETYNLDLIINTTSMSWTYFFDGYAFYPITQNTDIISITVKGDRRTWQYEESQNSKNILLNGFNFDSTLLQNIDYTVLNIDQIIIHDNQRNVHELLKTLNVHYGILPY